jgi:hypothetical protein
VNGGRTRTNISSRTWAEERRPCVNTACQLLGITVRFREEEMLRTLIRWGLVAGTIGVVALGTSGNAFASTITQPSTSPFAVPGSISATIGSPQSVDVTATGFTAGQNVFIEQCDGVDPASATWSVTIDCDFGQSPGPAIADDSGTAMFTGAGNNFQAFKNGKTEAQNKFNCLAPDDRDPGNGKPSFTTCRIRVSTNNTAVTGDQSFLLITLPSYGAPGIPTSPSATAGVKSATVSWTAPSTDNGSPITGYQVTPFDGFTALPPQEFNSTATTEKVTGLTAGHSYRFKVAAINVRGTSQDSATSNAVTPRSK